MRLVSRAARAAGAESSPDPRRVDWRFLLPNPVPGRVANLAGADVAASLEAVGTMVVPPVAGAGCHLAVARDPGSRELRVALAALAPGAALIVEWTWRGIAPALVRRRLRAAGFTAPRSYWPWPFRAPHQVLVPVEHASAVAWFLRSEPEPANRLRRLAARLRRRAWVGALRAGLTFPLVSVAFAPGTAPSPARRAMVLAAADAPGSPGDGLLLRTPGFHPANKVIAVVIARDAMGPSAVVKAARQGDGWRPLARERHILRALDGRVPDGSIPRVATTVPHPVRSTGAPPMLAESFVAGVPAHHLVDGTRRPALLGAAVAWSVALGRGTCRPASRRWLQDADRVLAGARTQLGPAVDSLVDYTRGALADVGPLPIVAEHRDFAPWNCVLNGMRLGVLDWESSRLRGTPGLDVIYFATYLALLGARAVGGRTPGDLPAADVRSRLGRVQAVYRQTWAPGAEGDLALHDYGAALGLDPDRLAPLRLLAWPMHAESEIARLRAAAQSRSRVPTSGDVDRSLFLALWRAEVEMRWA